MSWCPFTLNPNNVIFFLISVELKIILPNIKILKLIGIISWTKITLSRSGYIRQMNRVQWRFHQIMQHFCSIWQCLLCLSLCVSRHFKRPRRMAFSILILSMQKMIRARIWPSWPMLCKYLLILRILLLRKSIIWRHLMQERSISPILNYMSKIIYTNKKTFIGKIWWKWYK